MVKMKYPLKTNFNDAFIDSYCGSKWDYRFMEMAKLVSTWSKDPSTKVGCVATSNDKKILATGYNGFPKGMDDNTDMYEDRGIKYRYIIHAELNCICNASVHGVSLKDSHLYVWGLPICHECAKAVIQSGVTRVAVAKSNLEREDWYDRFLTSIEILKAAKIKIDILEDV